MPSYGTDAGLVAYLAQSGRVLPDGSTPSIVRFWGTAYVDMFEDMFRGTATAPPNSFPRNLWPVVPAGIEYAAYEAGFAWSSGIDIFGSGGTSGGQVIREKLDVMEVQYAAPKEGSGYWENNRFILPLAYALLLPYFKKSGFYPSAMVVQGEHYGTRH